MTSKGIIQKGKGALEDVADAAEEAYRATKTTIKTAYADGTDKCKKALHLTTAEGSSSSEAAPNVRNIVPPIAVTNNTPRAENYVAALPGSSPNATGADETTPLVHAADRSTAADGSTKSTFDDELPKRKSSIIVGEVGDEEGPTPPHDGTPFLPFAPELCRLSVIVVVGIIASIRSADTIRSDGVVPLHLAAFWTLLGFLAGHLLWPAIHKIESRDELTSDADGDGVEVIKGEGRSPSPQKSPLNKSTSRVSFNEERQGTATSRPSTNIERKRDYVFQLFRGVSSYLVTPVNVEPVRSRPTLTPMSSLADIPGDIWTTLEDATRRTKAYWEEHVYDKPAGELMQRLLKYDDFRTKPCSSSDYSCQESDADAHASIPREKDITEDVDLYAARMKTERLGHVNTGNDRASILQANIEVDPLFKLRGMDVFRADIPEERICRQPILEENGLRDVPTFVVNLMLPGANLVVYFQMPSWIKKFEDIVEEEDDAEDTKAFKRFLRGTDQYRNGRWKILPCLVDGPYIIKAMGLPQKEVTIAGGRVGATWHEYNESIDAETGKKRSALLEVDCDLISNPGVRKICNIVLGQVKNVRIDCAMIVEKPYLSEVEEPAACLGLWRMDRVDMSKAALVPEKDEEQLLREMSVLLNAEDLVGLKDDLGEEEPTAAY